MSYINEIKLEGEVGDKRFILPNGKSTKVFYDAKGLDEKTGEFFILDSSNDIVEYMDVMGHFTQNPTELAKCLCNYAQSGKYVPVKTFTYGDLYFCGLVDFPSKFLADEEIYEFIKNHEKLRYKRLCKGRCFKSILERLYYKHYISEVWKAKIKKLKILQEQNNHVNENIDSKELS